MTFPIHPKHPERICWGCDKLCPAGDMRCGNGSDRAQHPAELLGDDWWEWEQERLRAQSFTLDPSSSRPQ